MSSQKPSKKRGASPKQSGYSKVSKKNVYIKNLQIKKGISFQKTNMPSFQRI